MKLRFLALTASQAKEYPFMPGQIIEVDDLNPDVRRWLKYRHAEVVREEPESATVRPAETAVVPSAEPMVEPPHVDAAPRRRGRRAG